VSGDGRPSQEPPWPLLVLAVLALLGQAGLVVAVGISLAVQWPRWTRAVEEVQAVTPAAVAHPPAPAQDPEQARAETCDRLKGLLMSLNGVLVRNGHPEALGETKMRTLVEETNCQLDDPTVRSELERVRAYYESVGLEPPPVLPHLED